MNFRLLIVSAVTLAALAMVSAIAVPAAAQIKPLTDTDCGAVGIKCAAGDKPETLRNYALDVINVFLGLVGVAAFIFILLGGVRYISARGDESSAETAKKTILYAVIGLVVVGLAAIVVNFTLKAAGVGGELPGGDNLVGATLTIINIFLGVVGVTTLTFVLIGGVRYITSQGEEDKAKEGKRTILYAVTGLVVVGLAAVVVNFTAAAIGLSTGIRANPDLPAAIMRLINFFLVLAGLTALAYFIMGGIQYVLSQGETDRAEEAKRTILYAVIGLLVIGLAAVLVNFVISAFVFTWWYT